MPYGITGPQEEGFQATFAISVLINSKTYDMYLCYKFSMTIVTYLGSFALSHSSRSLEKKTHLFEQIL